MSFIFGIFLGFFLPAYSDYTSRTHVAEGLALASGVKFAVVDYYHTHETFPPDNAAAGLAAAKDIRGNAVESVEVSTTGSGTTAMGLITVTYNKKVKAGKTIILSTQDRDGKGTLVFECTGGTLENKFRPAQCRK